MKHRYVAIQRHQEAILDEVRCLIGDARMQAAAAAHSALVVYNAMLGQVTPPWDIAPVDMRVETLRLIDELLAGTFPEPKLAHQTWMEGRQAEGWRYGPTKDREAKTHPCLVPFEELPRAEQLKDLLVINVACASLGLLVPDVTVEAPGSTSHHEEP